MTGKKGRLDNDGTRGRRPLRGKGSGRQSDDAIRIFRKKHIFRTEIFMADNIEMEKAKAAQEYDASQIQVLEGLEAVRKRPGMYIGSTSSSGLHHLVYEIVDNAIDEALAGFCTAIEVVIEQGDVIRVSDNGRGIPVDIQEQTGKSALEVVFTVLHAGGKFGGCGYKVSGGLHGVGASVVNALSEWLEVEVHKEGKRYGMKFSRGEIVEPIHVLGETHRHGTTVRFKPDPEMFDEVVYDYDVLHTRMREQAFLNAGLAIDIRDEREGREQRDILCYEGGIREYVRYLNKHKAPVHEDVIYLSGTKGEAVAELALQYNDGYQETLVSFANDIHTPEGGMHETGFKTALTRVINAYGQKYNIIKGDDKVSATRSPARTCARASPPSSPSSSPRPSSRARPSRSSATPISATSSTPSSATSLPNTSRSIPRPQRSSSRRP